MTSSHSRYSTDFKAIMRFAIIINRDLRPMFASETMTFAPILDRQAKARRIDEVFASVSRSQLFRVTLRTPI